MRFFIEMFMILLRCLCFFLQDVQSLSDKLWAIADERRKQDHKEFRDLLADKWW
jgi:hypothetical protein